MNKLIDNSLVGLVLLGSAVYAVSALGPKGLRKRMWGTLARLAALAPKFMRLDRIASRFDEAAAGKTSGACGGCGSCGSEQSDSDKPPASEVRVPVAKIVRRH
jgi:hypothetical protein